MDNREIVRRFILTTFLFTEDQQALDDKALLSQTGIIDSMGALEITTFLEDTFEMSVVDDEIIPENIDSVDRIVAYVNRKLGTPK